MTRQECYASIALAVHVIGSDLEVGKLPLGKQLAFLDDTPVCPAGRIVSWSFLPCRFGTTADALVALFRALLWEGWTHDEATGFVREVTPFFNEICLHNGRGDSKALIAAMWRFREYLRDRHAA